MCGFPSSECVNKFFIFRWWCCQWAVILQHTILDSTYGIFIGSDLYKNVLQSTITRLGTKPRINVLLLDTISFALNFALFLSLKRSMNIYIVLYAQLLKYLYSLSIAFDLYDSFFSRRSPPSISLSPSLPFSVSRQSDSDIHINTCRYANKAQELREKLIWKYV